MYLKREKCYGEKSAVEKREIPQGEKIVDMANFDTGSAPVETVMLLKSMGFVNGMEVLSKSARVLIAADYEVGAIFKLDIWSK
jgi:hypothetical protein